MGQQPARGRRRAQSRLWTWRSAWHSGTSPDETIWTRRTPTVSSANNALYTGLWRTSQDSWCERIRRCGRDNRRPRLDGIDSRTTIGRLGERRSDKTRGAPESILCQATHIDEGHRSWSAYYSSISMPRTCFLCRKTAVCAHMLHLIHHFAMRILPQGAGVCVNGSVESNMAIVLRRSPTHPPMKVRCTCSAYDSSCPDA